jgi:hypothetical protein
LGGAARAIGENELTLMRSGPTLRSAFGELGENQKAADSRRTPPLGGASSRARALRRSTELP